MIVRKVIEIQAQSYLEEQFLLNRFPDAAWTTGVRGDFGTFYLSENKEKLVEKCILEFKEKNK
jgi:hypothetical protein